MIVGSRKIAVGILRTAVGGPLSVKNPIILNATAAEIVEAPFNVSQHTNGVAKPKWLKQPLRHWSTVVRNAHFEERILYARRKNRPLP